MYDLLVLVHILLLVYWLGTDLGVFYSHFYVLRRDLSPQTRAVAAKIMLALDLSPRVCLVLMLPVGLTLAGWSGLSPLAGPWLVAVWVAGLAWLAMVVTIYRRESTPLGHRLRSVDLVVRATVIVALLATAVSSLAGAGPYRTSWLAWKVVAYAVAVAGGLGIRFALAPFGPAFGELMASGSSDRVETAMAGALARVRPLVFVVWAAVLTAAALGVLSPG